MKERKPPIFFDLGRFFVGFWREDRRRRERVWSGIEKQLPEACDEARRSHEMVAGISLPHARAFP